MGENAVKNKIVESLTLNVKSGEAKIEVLLKGETSQINLSLNYALEGTALSITNVQANREWINGLADMFKDRYSKISLGKSGMLVDLLKHLF